MKASILAALMAVIAGALYEWPNFVSGPVLYGAPLDQNTTAIFLAEGFQDRRISVSIMNGSVLQPLADILETEFIYALVAKDEDAVVIFSRNIAKPAVGYSGKLRRILTAVEVENILKRSGETMKKHIFSETIESNGRYVFRWARASHPRKVRDSV